MMTENELRQMEPAARLYCETVGIDPDTVDDTPRLRWITIAHELHDLHIRMWTLRRHAFVVA